MDTAFIRAGGSATARRVPPWTRFITSQRDLSQQLQQKDVLLQEMQHRTANALQIVARHSFD